MEVKQYITTRSDMWPLTDIIIIYLKARNYSGMLLVGYSILGNPMNSILEEIKFRNSDTKAFQIETAPNQIKQAVQENPYVNFH